MLFAAASARLVFAFVVTRAAAAGELCMQANALPF
jgi:hypothetical protein